MVREVGCDGLCLTLDTGNGRVLNRGNSPPLYLSLKHEPVNKYLTSGRRHREATQATTCGGILVRRLHVMVSTEPASIDGMRDDVLIVASYDTVDWSNWQQ